VHMVVSERHAQAFGRVGVFRASRRSHSHGPGPCRFISKHHEQRRTSNLKWRTTEESTPACDDSRRLAVAGDHFVDASGRAHDTAASPACIDGSLSLRQHWRIKRQMLTGQSRPLAGRRSIYTLMFTASLTHSTHPTTRSPWSSVRAVRKTSLAGRRNIYTLLFEASASTAIACLRSACVPLTFIDHPEARQNAIPA